jgi:hypothetical protein
LIKTNTVFILGAGANVEVGMPTGVKLAEEISTYLQIVPQKPPRQGNQYFRDQKLDQAIRYNQRPELDALMEAASAISNGILTARSIDEFLDSFSANPAFSKVGKMAILRAIFKFERASDLYVKNGNFNEIALDQRKVGKPWYPWLIRMLTADVKNSEAKKALSNVKFVSFNYDRCLEQYLIHSLAVRFNTKIQGAQKLLGFNPVLHAYGSIDPLNTWDGNSGSVFGEEDSYDLQVGWKNIKTFSEEIDLNDQQLREIQIAIANADRLVFLGFAFHKPNMRLLDPGIRIKAKQIFATAFGMSLNDRQLIEQELQNEWGAHDRDPGIHGKPAITMVDQTCENFMADYQRTLMS